MSGVTHIFALLLCTPVSAWLVPSHSALIVVDMQNDFTRPSPVGSLYVNEAENIIEPINHLTSHHGWDVVIFTTDYHPANHISFLDNSPMERNHTWRPRVKVGLDYDANHRICGYNYAHEGSAMESRPNLHLHYGGSANSMCRELAHNFVQELWPVHCVQGTYGALIDNRVTVPARARVVRKGISTVIDSYGAFANQIGDRIFRESVDRTAIPGAMKAISENTLHEMLKDLGIQNVFVTGVALDYCVKNTALQAAERHFTTFVITDATKVADEHKIEQTMQELREHGVDVDSRLASQLTGRRLSNLTVV